MGDVELDLQGLEAALARHGDLVHDQARWRLWERGADVAADVVHDTFLIALSAPATPGDPETFRAWLLAVARNESLRVLFADLAGPGPDPGGSAGGRPDPAPPAVIADPSPLRHPGAWLPPADLRAMVAWAAHGLDRQDREILELGLRHKVPAPQLARILGMAPSRAAAALARLADDFGHTLGALVLARSDGGRCDGLSRLVERWELALTLDWRARLTRHVGRCRTCRADRALRIDPAGILRLPVMHGAPEAVTRWVLADATDPGLAAERAELARRAGPWDADGFPVPLDAAPPVRKRLRFQHA